MHRLYPIDPELARRMAERRRRLRLTQNQVALAAGLSESTVAKLETSRLPFSPEHLSAVECALAAAEQQVAAR